MGLSVGPQSFAAIPVKRDGPAAEGLAEANGTGSPLDPLIAALGRAVERSQTGRRRDTRESEN